MLVITAQVAASNTATIMSLWKHECYRVIADRFVSQDDKDWFEKSVKQVGYPIIVICVNIYKLYFKIFYKTGC